MSSNNNPDNTNAQPAGGAADEVLTEETVGTDSVSSEPAAAKKHRDEGLIFGFGDESEDTAETKPAEKESSGGGLVFGDIFLSPKPDSDAAAEEQPMPKKDHGRIVFTVPDPEEEKAEAERKAREEEERKAREEAERKAREEAERKAREEAERKAREEAERKAREEAERKAREEAERKAREEAERKAREEAERKAREEAERKAREEAEKKAREDAERERRMREKAAEAAAGGGLFFGDYLTPSEPEDSDDGKEIEDTAIGSDRIIFSWAEEPKAEKELGSENETGNDTEEEPEQEPIEINDRKARKEARRKAREEEKRRIEIEKKRKIEEEAAQKAKEEAERKAREEEERKAREEEERKAREEEERKAREEAERKAREEAERKAREEEERKAREEAERKAREEEERKAREEEERKAREEAERKAREEEERKAREEEEREAREEAERKAREEAERKAREEEERKAREEEERKAREEEERKAREEEERKAREEAERKAREEEERKAREEAERKAREEEERKAREEEERKAREEEERKTREEAERKAKEEEKARKEAERQAKEEAERKAKEEAKAKKEAERKAKEEAKAQKEAERKAKEEAEEERRAKEEAERKAAASLSLADVLGIAGTTAAAAAASTVAAKSVIKPAVKAATTAPAVKPAQKPVVKTEQKPAAKPETTAPVAKTEQQPAAKPKPKPVANIGQTAAEKQETKAPANEEKLPGNGKNDKMKADIAAALKEVAAERAEREVKAGNKPAVKTETKAPAKAETKAPEKAEKKAPAKPEKKAPAKTDKLPAATGIKELGATLTDVNGDMKAEIAAAVMAVKADKAKHGPAVQPETKSADKPAEAAEKKAEKPEKTAKKAKKSKNAELAPLKPMLSIANIVYTAVLFGGMVAAFIFLPRSGISESEQRMLAEFPQFSAEMLTKGQYTNGITEYFNDNVPFREEIKKAAVQMRKLYGISYNNAEVIGPMVAVTEEPEEEPVIEETEPPVETALPEMSAAVTEEPEVAETEVPAQTEAPVETTAPETTAATTVSVQHPNEIAEGVITNGQVVTKLEDGHWWGISLFGGGAGTKYADALNRFKKALGDDVNVYNMVVPTSGEYYLPDIYNAYNASHRKSIDSINEKLDGVVPVPAIDALAAHASEDIYLRTDHHWQPLGAYYAAKCFADTAGVPFADISTMEKVSVDGYMGTMWSFTKSANLGGDPEVFTYYKPSNSYTTYYYDTAYKFDYSLPFFVGMPTSSMYSTFMGGDKKIVRISTDAGTGRKLVVFKDSYGNAEIPFYFGSFDEIYVCDMRYFDLNAIDFIKFTGATDVLFTMCTFSAVGTNANGLDIVLSNPSTAITETAG